MVVMEPSVLIRIVDVPIKDPKINKDGSVDIFLKIKGTLKGLPISEHLKESICLLKLSPRIAKKYESKITTSTIIKTTCILQAAVNKKGIPFFILRPISLHLDNNSIKIEEKKQNLRLTKMWYHNKSITQININDIELTSNEHLKTRTINLQGILLACKSKNMNSAPIAVRQLESGKYELIAGIKSFIVSKILDFKTVQVHITELSHDEFLKENGIEHSKLTYKKKYNK